MIRTQPSGPLCLWQCFTVRPDRKDTVFWQLTLQKNDTWSLIISPFTKSHRGISKLKDIHCFLNILGIIHNTSTWLLMQNSFVFYRFAKEKHWPFGKIQVFWLSLLNCLAIRPLLLDEISHPGATTLAVDGATDKPSKRDSPRMTSTSVSYLSLMVVSANL